MRLFDPRFRNIYSRRRGRPRKLESIAWHDDTGEAMYTFPGDDPNAPDILYTISHFDGKGAQRPASRLTIYGKRATAYTLEPVWKFVLERYGDLWRIVSREALPDHAGNAAYWGVPPEYRGVPI